VFNNFSVALDICVDFFLQFSANYFGAFKRAPFFATGAGWKHIVDPASGAMEGLDQESAKQLIEVERGVSLDFW